MVLRPSYISRLKSVLFPLILPSLNSCTSLTDICLPNFLVRNLIRAACALFDLSVLAQRVNLTATALDNLSSVFSPYGKCGLLTIPHHRPVIPNSSISESFPRYLAM